MKKFLNYRFAPVLPALFLLFFLASTALAQPWSFAVFADNRSEYAAFRSVLEQVKSNEPIDPKFPAAELVLGVGDLDPLPKNVEIYNEIIGTSVPFIPVRGNHESPADVQFMLKTILPSLKPPVQYYDPSSITYYYDYKNARFISIDTYTPYGKNLNNPALLGWLEKAITSAAADHVFISFHEPYVPLEPGKDPLWGMLLKHSDKVRVVLVGHSHVYNRRFIPDTYGGIHFINAGNAGNLRHSDNSLTVVEISVDKKDVRFRTIQAPGGTRQFKITDQWSAAPRGD